VLNSRPAHRTRGAHPSTYARAALAFTVTQQRKPYRPSAVPPAPKEPARSHDHHRFAGSAPIPPQHHQPLLRSPPRPARAAHLTRHQPMTHDHQPTAERLTRRSAARARPRSRLRAARRRLAPGLDPERTCDESLGAALLLYGGCAARRRGRARPKTRPLRHLPRLVAVLRHDPYSLRTATTTRKPRPANSSPGRTGLAPRLPRLRIHGGASPRCTSSCRLRLGSHRIRLRAR
jgi:hypothetical protein